MQGGSLSGLVLVLTATTCALSLQAQQDPSTVTILRAANFEQRSAAEPVLIAPTDAASPFLFAALGTLSAETLSDPDNLIFINGMTLRTPARRDFAMSFVGDAFLYTEEFTTESAMNFRFGAGAYQMTFRSAITGNTAYGLTLPSTEFAPPAQVSNFAAAQAISPTADFTLRWNAWPGAPANGDVQVEISDVESGAVVVSSEFLPANTTSIVIPANTLEAGRSYKADVVLAINDTDDGFTYVGRLTSTSVFIRAGSGGGGGEPTPSRVTGVRIDGTDLELTIECTAGRALTVQRTSALGGAWTDADTSTPGASPATVRIPLGADGAGFFRARQ
jgi:hypothetical protein